MALLEQPFLGGAFNYPILFGVQIYFWIFIIGILVIVGSEIFWRVTFWEPLHPFHGLYKSFVDNTKACLVGDLNLDWILLSESAATIIFDPEEYDFALKDMSRWIKFRAWLYKPDFSATIAAQLEGKRDESTLITIGRIPTHLIIDTQWWTDRKSPQRLAIKEVCRAWNREHPDDQVHRFGTFIRYVEEGKIICPENVIMSFTVPWPRIDAAFPLIRSDAAWAGFVRQLAEKINEMANMGELGKWAVGILVFGGLIDLLMFIKFFLFNTPK